jgi:hypothetical protein
MNLFESIAVFQATLFNNDNERYVNALVTCRSIRGLMIYVYDGLVRGNEILPIDVLLKSEKELMWNHANEISQDLSTDERVELVKALYAIKKIV